MINENLQVLHLSNLLSFSSLASFFLTLQLDRQAFGGDYLSPRVSITITLDIFLDNVCLDAFLGP